MYQHNNPKYLCIQQQDFKIQKSKIDRTARRNIQNPNYSCRLN